MSPVESTSGPKSEAAHMNTTPNKPDMEQTDVPEDNPEAELLEVGTVSEETKGGFFGNYLEPGGGFQTHP